MSGFHDHDTSSRALLRLLIRMMHEQPGHDALPGLRYAVSTLSTRTLNEAHQVGDLAAMSRASRTLDVLDQLAVPGPDHAAPSDGADVAASGRESFAARIYDWELKQQQRQGSDDKL